MMNVAARGEGYPSEALSRDQRSSAPLARMGDILGWSGFDVTLVTGDEDLDRPIRVAHATELEDPSRFLRGGELIMTVGSELHQSGASDRFVSNLLRSGAAGVLLAVGVAGHAPPPELPAAAARAGLPLMTVPPTLPFVRFTEKFQELADKRTEHARLRREDGRMLDYVRRGYASPYIFRERFPDISGALFSALCVPANTELEVQLEGVIVEGWLDEMTLFLADDVFVRDFAETSTMDTFGVGSPVPLGTLSRTIKEAIAALALSMRRGTGAGPRNLSTLSGLVERLSSEQFAPFQDNVVKPLREYDARHGRSLWHTLVAYIEAGASLGITAERLGVHANSVRNRLGRITEITGLDPDKLEDQLALAVAVRGTRCR